MSSGDPLRVAVHQPGYHRYCGYFYKMLVSDVFVSFDTTQYVSREWQNRQVFVGKGINKWLSVPVGNRKEYIFHKKITDLKVVKDHWTYIQSVYNKTPYFYSYKDMLDEIYSKNWIYLNDLCDALTNLARTMLGINTQYIRDSANHWIPKGYRKADALIDAIKRATDNTRKPITYIARSHPVPNDFYLLKKFDSPTTELEKFYQLEISVETYHFVQPKYIQHQNNDGFFSSNLSIFDLLFNCGPESLNILASGGNNDFQPLTPSTSD